jgi:hypothetical protein
VHRANAFEEVAMPAHCLLTVYGVDGSWYVVPAEALDDDVDHWVFMLKRRAG